MVTRLTELFPGIAALSTDKAARAIDRRPQTLRRWACFDDGPIRPARVNGRLLWRIADLERLIEEGPGREA